MEFERYESLEQELLALIINARINLESANAELEKALRIWIANDVDSKITDGFFEQNIADQLTLSRRFAMEYLQFLQTTNDGDTIEDLLATRFFDSSVTP